MSYGTKSACAIGQCFCLVLIIEIMHVNRKYNEVTDGLSRLPLKREVEVEEEEYLKFAERSCPIDVNSIIFESRKDKVLNKVMQFMEGSFH